MSSPISASGSPSPGVELLWIPLGAGQHVVRWSGRLYESVSALRERRYRCALYHSALVVTTLESRVVIEMTPVPDDNGASRGVFAQGAVGSVHLGRFRQFRYEIRRWPNGTIPDAMAAAAVVGVTMHPVEAERLLALVPSVPTPVWGRDDLHAGEMWNSNSLTAWLLCRAGFDMTLFEPPIDGRAPGWVAGLTDARRENLLAAYSLPF